MNPNTPAAHTTWAVDKKTMEQVGVELTCLPLCSRLSLLNSLRKRVKCEQPSFLYYVTARSVVLV